MTHEELQLKIYQIDKYNEATDEQGTENWQEVDKALQALFAVVELHKPDGGFCSECSHDFDYLFNYPCQTIQTIEKALK